jgi:capsular polysaccharide biosynthesis protein
MDLVEVFRIIRARWYVMVPLLLVTIVLTMGVDRSIATKYQSASEMSLLASQSATTGTSALPGTGNAFLNFNSSLNDTADFLVRRLGSNDAANDLQQLGVTETYVVALAAAAQGPFITLTVTGPNPEHVLTSLNTLTQYTVQQLEKLQEQAGVKPVDMIRSMVIVPPGPPAAQNKTKTQDVLGVGIGGLVIAFLATFVVESVTATRRRRRRRVPFGADPGDDYDEDADSGPAAGPSERSGAAEPPFGGPASARWYGMDGASDLDREPFEAAHTELSVRVPGARD